MRLARIVDLDVIDVEGTQAAPESGIFKDLIAVLAQRSDVAGEHINIHVLRIARAVEEKAQVDPALEHVNVGVGYLEKPVQKEEMKDFPSLGIGKHI